MAAPLFVSTDLRTLRHDSQKLLLNSLVLSINQDQLGKLGLEIQQVSIVDNCYLTRPLHVTFKNYIKIAEQNYKSDRDHNIIRILVSTDTNLSPTVTNLSVTNW